MATSDKPSVDFNLDTYKTPGPDKPYSIVVGGKRYELLNPNDLDYRDLAKLQAMGQSGHVEEIEDALRLLVDPKEADAFVANKFRAAGFIEMLKRVNDYYGDGETEQP